MIQTTLTKAEQAEKDERERAIAIRLECLRMAAGVGTAAEMRVGTELFEEVARTILS